MTTLIPPELHANKFLHIQDQKAADTDGQSLTATTWNKHDLNTILTNEVGATLSSSVITLPAGTYFFGGEAGSYKNGTTQLRLRDTTNSVTLALGISMHGSTGVSNSVNPTAFGRFTLAAAADIELQQWVNNTDAGGDTFTTGEGEGEVWAECMIWKVG